MVLGLGGGNVIEIIIRAKDEFSSAMASINQTLRANTAGFIALTAAGAGITAIGVASLKVAGDLQKNTIAFETMLGSGEKATKMLQDLSEFAKRTPFQITEARQAAKQLLAVGVEADNIIPTLKAVGDIAAGTGGDFDRLVLNLGQVITQGKLTGREMMDFQRNMVPLTQALADHFKVSKDVIADMISAGKISSQDVIETFNEMTSAGGMFEDMMFKLSDTVPGKFSNLQDSITQLGEQIGKVFIPIATKILDVIIPIVTKIAEWTKEHPKLTQVIVIAVAALGGLLLVVGTLGILVPILTVGFSALAIVVGLVTWPVLAVIAAIGALIAIGYFLFKNWDTWGIPIIDALKEAVNFLGEAFKFLWSNYVKPLWDNMKEFWTWIKPVIDAVSSFAGSLGSKIPTGGKGRNAKGGSWIPGFQHGGYVPNTGLAMLHKGEYVIPANKTGASPITINIDNVYGVDANDVAQALQDKLNTMLTT